MTSQLYNNIPKQILHVIDSLEPIKENKAIKHYLKMARLNDTMANRTQLYCNTIKNELGIRDRNRDIEIQNLTTMITENRDQDPEKPPKEPQPSGIANEIDRVLKELRALGLCNLTLVKHKHTTLQKMFEKDIGTYFAFLRLKWRHQDQPIPRPPNGKDYYIQVARYYADSKILIPGNDHGYGFHLNMENVKEMNILRQINTRNLTTTCDVKGLYPIKGCEQGERMIEPGAVYEVAKVAALNETPDYNIALEYNSDDDDSVIEIEDEPMMESEEEDSATHTEQQTNETTVVATTTMVSDNDNDATSKADAKEQKNLKDEENFLEDDVATLLEPQKPSESQKPADASKLSEQQVFSRKPQL